MAHSFVGEGARAEVAKAIRDIEAQTSAEVVVAVRPIAGHYRHTDYLVGLVLAFLTLLFFLFDTHEFAIDTMPLETLLAFGLGVALSIGVAPLRRALTSRSLMHRNVRTAARAAFVDMGVSKTHGRSGILVFVAVFERRVEVVADAGIDTALLGGAWLDAQRALGAAVRPRADVAKLVAALRLFGPALGKVLPRETGDVNELPDEMAQA
jgi:putative membrane protein